MSYKAPRMVKAAITVRVPAARVRQLMRARRITTQSELINTLLAEEQERLSSQRVLRDTAGVAGRSDFDDRLL